jgi:enoyl-[acyl-carrier protein] reductase I
VRLLRGKAALISGVTNRNSIAWGIAEALYARGARIAFACLESNVRRVRKLAPQVHSDIIIPCDVRDDHMIAQAFDEVKEVFDGRLDILVHSIAYADLNDIGGEFIRISRSGWNKALEISAYSLVAFARHSRPLMNSSGGGSIITLTFGGAEKVVPGYNIMGVAKAALDATVRYLAYDLGPENIRVNAISAGPIMTPSSVVVEDFTMALKMMEERSPMLRNITVEDVGGAAVYLASDLSRCVTGAVIKVDSGMNIMAAPTKVHLKHRPSGTP